MDNDRIVQDRLFDLRDYFGGQALCGLLAAPSETAHLQPIEVAREAYDFADAMIEMRKRTGDEAPFLESGDPLLLEPRKD